MPPVALCKQLNGSLRPVDVVSPAVLRAKLTDHGAGELTKLLRVAGLPAPAQSVRYATEEELLEQELRYRVEDDNEGDPFDTTRQKPAEEGLGRAHFGYRKNKERRHQTAYEKNRDRFTANINWHNYDRLYKEAWEGVEAEAATENLYDNNPGERRSLISKILARVRIQKHDSLTFEEQLIAFRRLSILFETNFEFLQMNKSGKLWESTNIVLTPARDYNISSTAMRKRRLRNGDTGYSFLVHPDNRVTIYIPMDFGDDELMQELNSNIWDFHDLMNSGSDDLMPEGFVNHGPDFVPYNALMHRAKTTTRYTNR